MSARISKAVVLAAGLGTRLRPLTERTPKPMLPIYNIPLLEIIIRQLVAEGFTDIGVNSHYLWEEVEKGVAALHSLAKFKISREVPEILGRGGVFNPFRKWRGDEPILVINGDILLNLSLQQVLESHAKSGADATMVVLPQPPGGDRSVYVFESEVKAISRTPPAKFPAAVPHGFACVQVLTERFFALMPPSGNFDIIEIYEKAWQKGLRVNAFSYEGLWHDIGSPQQYWQAHEDLRDTNLDTLGFLPQILRQSIAYPGACIANQAVLEEDVQLKGLVVVGGGAFVGAGSQLKNCLIMPKAHVPKGSCLENLIIGPTFQVPIQVQDHG